MLTCMGIIIVCVCVLYTIQVLGATFDGASVNRRLVKIHDTSADLVYKVSNPFAAGRDVFLFSDQPHLMKTARNCWSSYSRSLWVCTVTHSCIAVIIT